MGVFGHDLRYAMRMLLRHRVSSAAAVLALALGVGPTTAIFSIVHATLLEPLPFPHPEQLVMVWSVSHETRGLVSAADYYEWKARAKTFQDLAVFIEVDYNLNTPASPERVTVRLASANAHRLMGEPMFLGRNFLPDEDQVGKNHVVMLTHQFWTDHFGADPGLIGREIRLNGEPYTVVGIMQPGTADRVGEDAWIPLTFTPDQLNHETRWVLVMGRLQPDATLPQAQQEMTLITTDLSRRYPTSNAGWSATVAPLQGDFMANDVKRNLWLLLAAVMFVVLIACVNIANLLLARGSMRENEVAIRASLGATAAHLWRQTLTESLVLAAAGGLLGIVAGIWILRLLLSLLPIYMLPAEADPRLSLPVMFFTLTTTMIAGLLFGGMPAWRASRVNLIDVLRPGGRGAIGGGGRRLRHVLVVTELALAVTLLAGAGLAIVSFWNRTHVDLGVNPDRVTVFSVIAERLQTRAQIDTFYRELEQRLAAIPGVSHAGLAQSLPIFGMSTEFGLVSRPSTQDAARPSARLHVVSPGYFDAYGVRLVSGRRFSAEDGADTRRVAMVSQRFVEMYLTGLDPLRERLRIAPRAPGTGALGAPVEWQIVGVFHDVADSDQIGKPSRPAIYLPFSQSPMPTVTCALRTTDDAAASVKAIAAAVQSLDPSQPISSVRPLHQVVDRVLAPERLNMALLAGLALVALLLAAVGIYGVMAFLVEQRTREIGLRMALGAGQAAVLGQIVREGLTLAIAGIGVGLIGAWFVGAALQSTLLGTGRLDVRVAAAVCVLLLITALIACLVPARRASTIDPMSALRQS
jgi:putative ABC transport system permease protein